MRYLRHEVGLTRERKRHALNRAAFANDREIGSSRHVLGIPDEGMLVGRDVVITSAKKSLGMRGRHLSVISKHNKFDDVIDDPKERNDSFKQA